MKRIRDFFAGILLMFLEYVAFVLEEDEHVSEDHDDVATKSMLEQALWVVYRNDEIECLPFDREMKIDESGVVFFKEKGKWKPYPEIVEVHFNSDFMQNR